MGCVQLKIWPVISNAFEAYSNERFIWFMFGLVKDYRLKLILASYLSNLIFFFQL